MKKDNELTTPFQFAVFWQSVLGLSDEQVDFLSEELSVFLRDHLEAVDGANRVPSETELRIICLRMATRKNASSGQNAIVTAQIYYDFITNKRPDPSPNTSHVNSHS